MFFPEGFLRGCRRSLPGIWICFIIAASMLSSSCGSDHGRETGDEIPVLKTGSGPEAAVRDEDVPVTATEVDATDTDPRLNIKTMADSGHVDAVAQIILLRDRGEFPSARYLAVKTLESGVSPAEAVRVETLLAEVQGMAREAPGWIAAIDLLGGDRAERRLARDTLRRAGEGATIVLHQALNTAEGEIFDAVIELLEARRFDSMFPTLIKRYAASLTGGKDVSGVHRVVIRLLPDASTAVDITCITAVAELLRHQESELFNAQEHAQMVQFFADAVYRLVPLSEHRETLRLLIHRVRQTPLPDRSRNLLAMAAMDCAFLDEDYASALAVLNEDSSPLDADWVVEVRNKLLGHIAEQEGRYEEAVSHFKLHLQNILNEQSAAGSPAVSASPDREVLLGFHEQRIGNLLGRIPGGAEESAAAYARARAWYMKALDLMDMGSTQYAQTVVALESLPYGN